MINKITNNISPLEEVNKINDIIDSINTYKIGAVIQSVIPLNDNRLHILDGSQLFQTDIYESFVSYMRNLYESNYLYAWVYNDGSDNHIIYTNTSSLNPSQTVLLNADGTEYTGAINKMIKSTHVNLKLDKKASLTLTADSYVDVLDNADKSCKNIISNGHTLYYNKKSPENKWLKGKTIKLKDGGEIRGI